MDCCGGHVHLGGGYFCGVGVLIYRYIAFMLWTVVEAMCLLAGFIFGAVAVVCFLAGVIFVWDCFLGVGDCFLGVDVCVVACHKD